MPPSAAHTLGVEACARFTQPGVLFRRGEAVEFTDVTGLAGRGTIRFDAWDGTAYVNVNWLDKEGLLHKRLAHIALVRRMPSESAGAP